MNCEFAIAAKNILPINPQGRFVICTLWTPPRYVLKILAGGDIDLSPESSPIALIGGLYGGGLKIMLRNLLYNPQIERVIMYGKDFSGVREHLMNFFADRLVDTGRKRLYTFADGTKRDLRLMAIAGRDSSYIMDELLRPEHFERAPAISDIAFGRPEYLVETVREFAAAPPPDAAPPKRLFIELPKAEPDVYPSEPHSHLITAKTITKAWEKMLYRLSRFGRPVTFRDGKKRHELLNMKAVITHPGEFNPEQLAAFNLPLDEIKNYQEALVSAGFTEADGSYAYGHRMRVYFGRDMLCALARDLAQKGDSRHAFMTLWDNARDVEAPESPCLVSLFFRKVEDALDLTATFRSHNGTRAWPRNAFGLYRIMEEVCLLADAGLRPGALTVLSLSISVDPGDLDQVAGYIEAYKNRNQEPALDPYGYVKISISPQAGEIVLCHYSPEDEMLDEYRAKNPSEMARKLHQREVISDISHALYIGAQLERAWYCLLNNQDYVQDKTATVIFSQSSQHQQ